MPGRVHLVVENLRLPGQLAGHGVEGIDVVVVARIDDRHAVNGHVPVVLRKAAHDLGDVVRNVAAVLPQQVAGHGVDRLQVIVRVRHEQHAAVRQRRPLLGPRRQGPRPYQLQIADVVAIHLVERAVAPTVLRAAPHQPVARRRILEHGVGDGNESGIFTELRCRCGERREDDGRHCDG